MAKERPRRRPRMPQCWDSRLAGGVNPPGSHDDGLHRGACRAPMHRLLETTGSAVAEHRCVGSRHEGHRALALIHVVAAVAPRCTAVDPSV